MITTADEFKFKKDLMVEGVSIINHQIRVSLGLTCIEYCLAELIYMFSKTDKILTVPQVNKRLGLSDKETASVLKGLLLKKIVERKGDKIVCLPVWLEKFDVRKDEFELFWNKDGKVCWTGSKPQAKDRFYKVREHKSLEYLIAQRDAYFRYLNRETWLKKMMCSVFLNPQTKRYEEPWDTYPLDKPKNNEHKSPANIVITTKDVEDLF
jgi:hypothetical protein